MDTNMKKYCLILLFFTICISGTVLGQDEDAKKERAEQIYKNLEYNTEVYDDLKPVWNITDPLTVRYVFNKFMNKNVFRENGEKVETEVVKAKIEDVYASVVGIEVKKRYFDDELEYLRFYNIRRVTIDSSDKEYFFDPLYDHLEIKEVLGEESYNKLKKRNYAHNELTKTLASGNFYGENFDIYLHLYRPKILFYTLNNGPGKRLFAGVSGNWGNDLLAFPAWNFPDYFGGIALAYVDSVVSPDYFSGYMLDIGYGIDVKQPEFDFNSGDTEKRLYKSGEDLFFRFRGNPFTIISDKLETMFLQVEGMFAFTEFDADDYNLDYISRFYSIRNYMTFFVEYKNFLEAGSLGDLSGGVGYGFHDINLYSVDPFENELVAVDTEHTTSGMKNYLLAKFGIGSEHGLFNYSVNLSGNYNFENSYGYAGLTTRVMLSREIGFEVSMYKAFKNGNEYFPYYRLNNYIVFSPIIRINY